MRDISLKYRRTKKSLAWDFYDIYEEDGKETGLNWYFYNFGYANKYDKMKEGMTGMIMYTKRNTYSFRNHVVTAHKVWKTFCEQ